MSSTITFENQINLKDRVSQARIFFIGIMKMSIIIAYVTDLILHALN